MTSKVQNYCECKVAAVMQQLLPYGSLDKSIIKVGFCKFIISGLICLAFLLTACKAEQSVSNYEDVNVIEAQYGEYKMYIPEPYLKFYPASVGKKSVLFHTLYPGDNILEVTPKELREQGNIQKKIMVLISHYPKSTITFSDLTKKTIGHLKAYEKVGEEYDLTHQKQPPDQIQDKKDMWIEYDQDKAVSYITCGEKLSEYTVPQCSHYLDITPKLSVMISYDMRLLPEWKLIKENMSKLIDSFWEEETAKRFAYQKQMNSTEKKVVLQ